MRASIPLLLALLSGVAAMPEEDRPPPNEPPEMWRASASEQAGKVVVRLERPEYVSPRKVTPAEPMRWHALKPVTLGETVHAFTTDGKRATSDAVLKALARPKGVAVFARFCPPVLDPDPFYLAMLREGSVVLVVQAGDIADPIP
jgi:hypothetical protein